MYKKRHFYTHKASYPENMLIYRAAYGSAIVSNSPARYGRRWDIGQIWRGVTWRHTDRWHQALNHSVNVGVRNSPCRYNEATVCLGPWPLRYRACGSARLISAPARRTFRTSKSRTGSAPCLEYTRAVPLWASYARRGF